MFLVVKLLMLGALLFNLKSASGIQQPISDEPLQEVLRIERSPKLDNSSHTTTHNPYEFRLKPRTSNKEEEIHFTDLVQKPEFLTVTTTTKGIASYNRETLPKCPDGYTHLEASYNNYSICYFITEPTSFPSLCPYPTTLEYYYVTEYFQVTNQTSWVFTNRNVSSIGKKNCLAYDRGVGLFLTNCADKHPGVCVYTYDSGFLDGVFRKPSYDYYCKRRYNESCIGNDFSSGSKCYCRNEAQIEQQPRNTFCKKLVEIKRASENNLLVRLLQNHEHCWIGLQNNLTLYQWSATGTISNYDFWANNVNLSKPYGALGRNGWLLEDDGALTCAICEVEVQDHPQVQLHIKHNKTFNVLDVEVENAVEVFQNITCFDQNSEKANIDLRYNKENFVVTYVEFPFMTNGYYWCKALQMPNLTPVYSNTIFIASSYSHEYAVLVTFAEEEEIDVYMPKSNDILACNSIKRINSMLHVSSPIKIIKYNETQESIEVLCHITTRPSELSITKEFKIISNLLKNASATTTNLASIEVCLPSTTISANRTLHWPETLIGVTTIPAELCLQVDGSPVTRTCSGNFEYGSRWLDVQGTCADVTYSERTHLLDDLLKSETITPSNLSMNLLNITGDTNNFTTFEVHLVSKTLEKLAAIDESIAITEIAKTINNIMHFEPTQLKVAQGTLNSTDIILYSLDEILARTKINDSGYASAITEKVLVQISDLNKSNIKGIKLGSSETQNSFDPTKINPLKQGTSKEDLMKENNLELAMLLPQELHDDIVNCVGSKASSNLITTVFYDDVFFNEQKNKTNQVDGKVLSVTIPNFDCSFTAPLQVIFNPSTTNNTLLKCASWNYGFNDVMESAQGQWFIEGEPKTFGNSAYQVCEFNHTTHFTLLILSDFIDINPVHTKALDVTTAVGSGLSLLGILMIFLTAIMFRSFRTSANAVLINFSITITANIVLLFVADNVAQNEVLCTVFGAAVHFVVLSQFCWMLVIAILQYKKKVISLIPPTHLVAKTCACGWGIPLIPVIIIVSISTDNYGKNSHGFCYALGHYFTFGVVVPCAIMIFLNLLVFIKIMLRITSTSKLRVHKKKKVETSSLQLKLAFLLFFLLGLTWGFGLLASVGAGIIYSYLFCFTATLQGFVLFAFFIVLNEKSRVLWMVCCKCQFEKENKPNGDAIPMIPKPRNPTFSEETICDRNNKPNLTTNEMLRRLKDRDSLEF